MISYNILFVYEIVLIVSTVGHERKHFWTSGTKLGFDDGFHWIGNGKSVIFTDWSRGQPDGQPNENCLQIWNTGDGVVDDTKWNDRNCADSLYFICEEDQIEYEYCLS